MLELKSGVPLLFFFLPVVESALLFKSAASISMCCVCAGCTQLEGFDDVGSDDGPPSEGNAEVEDASGASEGMS